MASVAGGSCNLGVIMNCISAGVWRTLLNLLLMLVAAVPSMGSDDKGQTFETSGATIYFEVIGSKGATPLILVNGGPGFSHNYLHKSVVWEALAKNRQVVFYDQRGTGRSLGDHRGQTFTLKDQIDDLEALRAHLGYEHIDLLGHWWGGFRGWHTPPSTHIAFRA
jgi:proline iminopeptidase